MSIEGQTFHGLCHSGVASHSPQQLQGCDTCWKLRNFVYEHISIIISASTVSWQKMARNGVSPLMKLASINISCSYICVANSKIFNSVHSKKHKLSCMPATVRHLPSEGENFASDLEGLAECTVLCPTTHSAKKI